MTLDGQTFDDPNVVHCSDDEISDTLAFVDDLEMYIQISSHPLHKTNKLEIVYIDVLYSKDMIATGGIDTNVVIFDRPTGQIVSTLSGHSKKVTSVKIVDQGDIVLIGSADKTVRVWQGSEDGSFNCRHILKDHTTEGYRLLNANDHAHFLKRNNRNPAEYRLDICHQVSNYVDTVETDTNLVFVVGAMTHGKIETNYTDDYISVSSYPLSAAFCITSICLALVDKWDIL